MTRSRKLVLGGAAAMLLAGCGSASQPAAARVSDNTQCFGILHARPNALINYARMHGWGDQAPNAAISYVAYCKGHHRVQSDLSDIDYNLRSEPDSSAGPSSTQTD